MSTTELRDPNTLRRHPLHKAHVPEPDKSSPEWKAFVDTVHADGRVRIPLLITSAGLVMDGWRRREAARDLQLTMAPCQICEPEEAALLIVEPLIASKRMSRGAAVYLAIGLLPEYIDAAERRRLNNVAAGKATTEEKISSRSTPSGGSNVYLSSRWGCDEATIRQARQVRDTFHNLKTFGAWLTEKPGLGLPASHPMRQQPAEAQAALRDEFEPLLYSGAKSLWNILPAAAGRITGQRNEPVVEQLDLFRDAWTEMAKRLLRLSEDGRDALRKKLPFDLAAAFPQDFLEELGEAIPKAIEKQQRKQA